MTLRNFKNVDWENDFGTEFQAQDENGIRACDSIALSVNGCMALNKCDEVLIRFKVDDLENYSDSGYYRARLTLVIDPGKK
jgi:hypothetical protein